MTKITSRDIRVLVAGALALEGFRALIGIPYYFTVAKDSVLIGGAVITGLALPIGIGIFLGRWSALIWAQIYLWLRFIVGCVAIPFFWHFYHQKVWALSLRSLPELLVTAALLGLIYWTTSERFRYEPDA